MSVAVSTADSNGKTVELAPGLWELRWPGHDRVERFTVAGGDAVEVALRSISGRCDILIDGTCQLVRYAMRKRFVISFHKRESKG